MKILLRKAAFAILVLQLSACATHKLGIVADRDIQAFSNYAEFSGIEIAAELYADEAKTKEAFYLNVNEKNYYPVMVAQRRVSRCEGYR